MGLKTKIFVGHLPDGCKSEDLQTLFEKYGAVAECDVINKYGFVHMTSSDEAEEAIKALNNYNFKGSTLSVEQSRSKLHPEPGAPGRARGGQNSNNTGRRDGPMGGGGPFRNGYPPRNMDFNSRNGYYDGYPPAGDGFRSRFDGPPRDPYYDTYRERPRPYPISPYERRAPLPPMPPTRDDTYSRRPLPPPPSLRDDMYSRRGPPPGSYYGPSEYDRAPPADYLYSRRSPPGERSIPSPLSTMRRPAYY